MPHYICKRCESEFGQSVICVKCATGSEVIDKDMEALMVENEDLRDALEELCICVISEPEYKCPACKVLEKWATDGKNLLIDACDHDEQTPVAKPET